MPSKKSNRYLELLKDKCTDYAKLSRASGINYQRLYNKINNVGTFNVDEITQISNALGLDIEDVHFYFFPEMFPKVNKRK